MNDFINKYSCLNCECCPKSNPFNLLTKDELKSIDNTRMEVAFKKGEIIYKQGTPLTHAVIVHGGFGKKYIEGTNGRNLILGYTKSCGLNGGIGVFIDQRHHSSLMAVTDCECCFIDIHVFKSIMFDNGAFLEAYLKDYSKGVQQTYNQMVVLTQKNMEGRMAEAILKLYDQVFDKGDIEHISNQDLSELTAMTKESAIRVLKEFNDDGLIQSANQTIKILDRMSLEQIAQYG